MSEDPFGQRLERARRVAGLSRAQVATALAVRRVDVARIEHGRRRVSALELGKLARLYRKPSARCLLEPAGAPPIRYFRSDPRVDERDLAVVEEAGDWLAYYAWLERCALGAQRYEFPTYPLPSGHATEQGERLAAEERSRVGLGDAEPVRSMVALLEREGVKLAVHAFHPKSQAFGCFLFSEELGPCVILNRERPPAERRFAAAHAYAHLLADQEDVSGGVCGPFRAHELDELRASAFAAAFLLPPDGVAAALGDLDTATQVTAERVTALSHAFGASYPTVVARLADLDWIDARRRTHLERQRRSHRRDAGGGTAHARRAGGAPGEPGGTESEPARFRSVAVEAWHCGRISTAKLADLLDLPEADVALLLDQSLFEHRRLHRGPSTEPDRL
ncbi:MAG TPA: helix-turn-helix transcriptional regulator [Actinomycetes bacterium]|jgi:Zn-dependent peptidase ImmA (M78 family)/DNA-binding XRE family transcriptional regulator|nr:helix-turn-helix transcriptional regulator [Actinomycetes bacterium]